MQSLPIKELSERPERVLVKHFRPGDVFYSVGEMAEIKRHEADFDFWTTVIYVGLDHSDQPIFVHFGANHPCSSKEQAEHFLNKIQKRMSESQIKKLFLADIIPETLPQK